MNHTYLPTESMQRPQSPCGAYETQKFEVSFASSHKTHLLATCLPARLSVFVARSHTELYVIVQRQGLNWEFFFRLGNDL